MRPCGFGIAAGDASLSKAEKGQAAVVKRDRGAKALAVAETTKSCPFCDVSVEKGFDILLEDHIFVVFRDHNPSSAHHIQVITKEHIPSIKSLRKPEAQLVKMMRDIGHKSLDKLSVPRSSEHRKLGFHIPPYISVPHLHMHAQGLPYISLLRQVKYPVVPGGRWWFGGAGKHKGFSWFCDVEQAIAILESGGRVRVGPC